MTFAPQNVMREEKKEGGKPMSSVESLDFSVIHEEDVEIGVKDIDGWKLKSGHQMVFCSHCLSVMQQQSKILRKWKLSSFTEDLKIVNLIIKFLFRSLKVLLSLDDFEDICILFSFFFRKSAMHH